MNMRALVVEDFATMRKIIKSVLNRINITDVKPFTPDKFQSAIVKAQEKASK